jgi:hypothetical protein
MPHIPGVLSAGIPEATRLAQAVIHRGAEATMVVVTGERADRIRAERIPEAGAGERIAERRRRDPGRDEDARRDPERDEDGPAGGLVDLQA